MTATVDRSKMYAGLRIVGFEGESRADATPARVGLVCADTRNRLVFVNEETGEREVTDMFVRDFERKEPLDELCATRLPHALTPRVGAQLLILGECEFEYSHQLIECRGRQDPLNLKLWNLFSYFHNNLPFDDELGVVRLGDKHMVWYIPEERVTELEWRCASIARIRIVFYLHEKNFVQMERMAWWLFRAAAKEQDEVDAAAALTLAGFDPMSKFMLESVGLSQARKDGRLAHAKMKWRQLALR